MPILRLVAHALQTLWKEASSTWRRQARAIHSLEAGEDDEGDCTIRQSNTW